MNNGFVRENLFRLAFIALMVGLLLLIGRNAFAQKHDKAPPPITIEVWPKLAIPNPYRRMDFHIRWQIEPHEDNRAFTLTCDCGELSATSRDLEGVNSIKTRDLFLSFTVAAICLFQICVFRVSGKQLCARQIIITPDQPP